MKTSTTTLIAAMYELARTIQIDDVANAAILEAAERIALQEQEIDDIIESRESAEKLCRMLARINNDIILAMQAALIDYRHSGMGADRAMEWIENTLYGPGLIPSSDDDGFNPDAQTWYDAQKSQVSSATDDDWKQMYVVSGDPFRAKAISAAVAAEREACAQVCENGHFLHDQAPTAIFGKECARAIRFRSGR